MKRIPILAAVAALALAAAAEAHAPMVIPRGSVPYGKTYSQWGALAWQQVLAIPKRINPENPKNPDHCNLGAGKVRLLVGAQANVKRSCTVPADSALLVSPIAIECSTLEKPPFHGNGARQLRRCTDGYADGVHKVSLSIDGKPVPHVMSYQFVSGPFQLHIPPGALIPAGRGHGMSSGWWLIIAPLPEGTHVIHWDAAGNFPGYGEFNQFATYRVTVR